MAGLTPAAAAGSLGRESSPGVADESSVPGSRPHPGVPHTSEALQSAAATLKARDMTGRPGVASDRSTPGVIGDSSRLEVGNGGSRAGGGIVGNGLEPTSDNSEHSDTSSIGEENDK